MEASNAINFPKNSKSNRNGMLHGPSNSKSKSSNWVFPETAASYAVVQAGRSHCQRFALNIPPEMSSHSMSGTLEREERKATSGVLTSPAARTQTYRAGTWLKGNSCCAHWAAHSLAASSGAATLSSSKPSTFLAASPDHVPGKFTGELDRANDLMVPPIVLASWLHNKGACSP